MAVEDLPHKDLIWLHQLARKLLGAAEIEPMRALLCHAAIELLGADRAFIFVGEDPRTLRSLEQNSEGPAEGDADVRQFVIDVAKGRSLVAEDGDEGSAVGTRHLEALSLSFVVGIPLSIDASHVGVVYVDSKTDAGRLEGKRPLLHALGELAGSALKTALRFRRANNDPLTGLPNNSYFTFELEKCMHEAPSEGPCGVLLLDIDHFKRVNEAAGAEAGDEALVDIAMTIREVSRADGMLSRYGSDKFAVLLPADPSVSIGVRLRDVAERARAAVAAKTYEGVKMSVSIGGVSFPREGVSQAIELIAAADDQLSQARSSGEGGLIISS